jgi:glycosyltransferase involved in cell wall biosynthesis
MACALAEAGAPVVVLAQAQPGAQPDGPVPVVELPVRRGRLARMLSGPRVIARLRRMRPSVVQVNCLDLLPWAVVARAILHVPVVYDSNEDYAAYMLIKEWVPRRARTPLAAVVGAVEPALAGRLDAVTTADGGTARRFRGRARQLEVVFNFPRRATAQDESPATPGETSDVLYHGTLHGYYRDHIVEACRRLAARGMPVRWSLAVRGSGPEGRDDLDARLRAAGLRDRFTLDFDVPFTRMPAIVAGTRVGFIPLPDEEKYRVNLPRKLFEFMAAGRPAVVSDLPPIRELVGAADCCILVRPGDDEAYVEALASLLSDPARAAAMGERGRRLVLERLNAEAAVAPYVAMMERLRGGV